MLKGYDASSFLKTHGHLFPEEPNWMSLLREQALQQMHEVGLPNRKHESWKYTNLKKILDEPYHATKNYNYVNIKTPREDSPVKIEHTINGHLSPAAEEFLSRTGTHATGQLNIALLQEVLVITVAPKAIIETIEIELPTNLGPSFCHIVFNIGQGAEASATIKAISDSTKPSYQNTAFSYKVGDNAKFKVTHTTAQPPNVITTNTTNATNGKNGQFHHFNAGCGSKLHRNDISAQLIGEGAHCELLGLYLLDGTNHLDNQTIIDHVVPHATSHQYYKGILGGSGRGVFNGQVIVRPDAQKTNAQQLNKNLMLSKDAEIDTKPQLEIEADDVKCSHGATIGQLNEDELFYLKSRGISPKRAEQILSRAFAEDVLSQWQGPKDPTIDSMIDSYFAV